MIIKNVDEETSLVIVKTFEIQSCIGMFHTFQYSWQPKFGKVLNARNEDELFSLVHFFIKYGGRVKVKVNGKK